MTPSQVLTEIPAEFPNLKAIFSTFCNEIDNSLFRKVSKDSDKSVPNSLASLVSYSSDLTFNARVQLTTGNSPSYTFNLGACFGLADAVSMLATNTEFMPEIPFPKQNVVHHHNMSSVTRYYDYSYIMKSGRIQISPFSRSLKQPYATERGNLGDHLFELAAKFLSWHEQSHYILGHLHFIADYLGGGDIQEAWLEIEGNAKKIRIPSNIRRALEYEADGFAAYRLFNAEGRPLIVAPEGLRLQRAEAPQEWQFFVFLAIALVVGILDRAERASSRRTPGLTHPSAAARLLSILRFLQARPPEWSKNLRDSELWQERLLKNCAILFEILECSPLRAESFNEFLDQPAGQYEMRESQECHSGLIELGNIQPTLERFRKAAWESFLIILNR